MGLSVKKIWLWFKLIVILLIAVYVTLFFSQNGKHSTPIWLFINVEPTLSLNVIVLVTAAASLVVFYTIRKVGSVLHEMNKLRQADQTRDRERRMEELAKQVEKKLQMSQTPPRESGK